MANTLKRRTSRGGDASPWPASAGGDSAPAPRRAPPPPASPPPEADENDGSAWSVLTSTWRKLTDDTSTVEAAVVDKVRR
jgi:hypothetical protein